MKLPAEFVVQYSYIKGTARRILCYVYRRNGIPGWRIFKDTDIL